MRLLLLLLLLLLSQAVWADATMVVESTPAPGDVYLKSGDRLTWLGPTGQRLARPTGDGSVTILVRAWGC